MTSWNPPGPTTGYPGCMALNSSALFITGNFVGFTGVGTRKYLAALNLDTGAVLDWSPNLNSFGASCFADDSIVYIGGGFTSLGDSSPRSRLASIDTNSDSLTSWAPSFDGSINDIKLTSNTMFLAGAFQNVGGQGRGRLASINLDTQALNSWSPNADGEVYTLTASNDAVRVGGNFRNIAGVSQSFYSELNPLSAALQGANPQPDGPVYSILDRDGDVYLGGTFRSLGVTPRTYVGNFAVDGVLGSFNPVITEGSENGVHAMITGPQLFYMAGAFSTVGGQRRRNLASFNRDFSIVSWLPPTSTSNLLTLKANGPEVFVGGEGSWPLPALFSIVEDAGTPSLSRWAPSFLGSRVNALSVGNNLYVGGDRGLFVYHEICGNGSREGSETCDDGNTNALDGCSAFCLNEGVGIALPSGTNVTISQGAVGHLSVVSSRTNISDSVPINLSVQTISPTADITIDPLVVPSSSPVDMNIHVGAAVPTGDYTVIIQGQAGSLININGFTITVTNSIGTGGSASGGTSGDSGSGGSGTGGSSGSGGTTDGSGGDTGLPGGGVSGISGGSGSDGTGGASGASGTGVTPGEGAGASSSGGCSCHVTPEMY